VKQVRANDQGHADQAQPQGRGRGQVQRREAGDRGEQAGRVPAAVAAAGRSVEGLLAPLGDLGEADARLLGPVHRDTSR
jgi:hypothetical protein